MSKHYEKSDQELLDELVAENDPALRAEVRAALKAKGIDRPHPFFLELALKYGAQTYGPYFQWFEKRGRLAVHLRQHLRAMLEIEPLYWPHYAANIISPIINGRYEYYYRCPPLDLSPAALAKQPTPQHFLQALQDGVDPKIITLTICNTWLSQRTYNLCQKELGHDVLQWDDARSLYWQDWQANRPQNANLCDTITIDPADLVAIEPFLNNGMADYEYDIYGATIAEVTSYRLAFTPKDGIPPKTLMAYIEAAVNDFIEQGNKTFSEPNSRFNNPHNAYARPCRLEDEDYFSIFGTAIQLTYQLEKKYPDIVHAYEKSCLRDPEGEDKDLITLFANTDNNIQRLLRGEKPTHPLPPEMLAYVEAYLADMRKGQHADIADNGDIVLKKHLIFDDILELYKFCDGFLTPSPQVAHALEAARYTEECGPIKKSESDRSSINRIYTNKTAYSAHQPGNLQDVPPDQVLDKAQHDILLMLGTAQSDLRTAFYQVGTLAHGTIEGLLPDGTGLYPPQKRITDAHAKHELDTPDDLLTTRTQHMLERMANAYAPANSALPLKERFLQSAKNIADIAAHNARIEAICKKYMRDTKNRKPAHAKQKDVLSTVMEDLDNDVLAQERVKALACLNNNKPYILQDEGTQEALLASMTKTTSTDRLKLDITTFDHTTQPPAHLDTLGRFIWWRLMSALQDSTNDQDADKTRKPQTTDAAYRGTLTTWGGAIGLQLPRGFEDTSYITRNTHTPFARPGTELPAELAIHTQNSAQNERLRLPDMATIFKPKPN